MAYVSYDKLCRRDFYNDFSAKYIVKDLNLNQIKLKVNDAYKNR